MNTPNVNQELATFLAANPDPIPEETLEWVAANPDLEVHKLIEWDDTIAGHKYRLYQCRRILKNYTPVFANREPRDITVEVHRVHMIPGSRPNSYMLAEKADKAKVDAQTRRYLAHANGNLASMLDLAEQKQTPLSDATLAKLERMARQIQAVREQLDKQDATAA